MQIATGAIASASPEWTRWLAVLSGLRYDPVSGVAPHKPLLLLVVCDLAGEGKLDGALLRRDGDLAFRFSSLWKIVSDRRRTKPDVRLPFFHLRTEKVWQPLEADGRPTDNRKRAVLAQLDVTFLACLKNADFRALARRTMIAKYFQPQERAELYSLTGLDVPPEDVVAADATRFLASDAEATKRDAKFCVRVLPAYDFTCALTGYRMITPDGTTVLDAAHIHQFKKGGSNHPTNGVALSKTAHWLFDKGFWSISDDYKVLVTNEPFDERGAAAHLLRQRAGARILTPKDEHYFPDHESLRWHRRRHGFEHA
jgi:putative restriction endonuclease